MPTLDTTIHELDSLFRSLFGPPSGSVEYLRWWSKPTLNVAFEPRGTLHCNVWFEASAKELIVARPGLKFVEYAATAPRSSSIDNCPRLKEGHAAIRVKCRPADLEVMRGVLEMLAISRSGPPSQSQM